MATVRISQLTAITTPTDDDVLIINDADTNTRKITFGNLTAGLLNTSGVAQTKSGSLSIGGNLTAVGNLTVDTDTLFVDSTNNRVGIRTTAPGETLDVSGNVRVRNQGVVQLGDSNNSNYIGLRSPSAIATDFVLTLPNALPTQGNFITYDTAGLGSFAAETAFASNELRAPYLGARGVGSNVGEVRFYELVTNGGQYISFQAPGNLSSVTSYTLPGSYPASNGLVLASDTTGNLSWVAGGGGGGGAAGSGGDVQFNDGGILGAEAAFNYNSASNTLSLTNLSADGVITQGSITERAVFSNTNVAALSALVIDLGTQASFQGYKLIITAKDTTTGFVEMYEHFIVQDGLSGISEVTGANVQAPVPGTFLTTPSATISAGSIECAITNTAVSANPLAIAVTVLKIVIPGLLPG